MHPATPKTLSNHYFKAWPQERHCGRRFAFSVPHDWQRLYIVRANQFVMSALTISIPANTATLNNVSFNS